MHVETVYFDEDTDLKECARQEHCEGMHRLGGGLYGTVYGKEGTPYVVKLMRACDSGYLGYARTVTELGQGMDNVPRIHRIFHYRFRDKGLYGWDENPGFSGRDYFVFYLERLNQPTKPMDRGYGMGVGPAQRYVRILNAIVYEYQQGRMERFLKLRVKHQDLVVLLALAFEEAKAEYFDLHAGNVMARGGRFVVTDPLAG